MKHDKFPSYRYVNKFTIDFVSILYNLISLSGTKKAWVLSQNVVGVYLKNIIQ